VKVPDHATVLAAVRAHQPQVRAGRARRDAATALVVADLPTGPELLLIERAHRAGDRFSGHMALPGGRTEPHDVDLAATAARETHEEVGVLLGRPVGRLDDVAGPHGGRVAVFVHAVDGRPPTVPEPAEVAEVVWLPLVHLLDPVNAVRHSHRGLGPVAGVRYERFTVWGMTRGILEGFAGLLGHELHRPRGTLW